MTFVEAAVATLILALAGCAAEHGRSTGAAGSPAAEPHPTPMGDSGSPASPAIGGSGGSPAMTTEPRTDAGPPPQVTIDAGNPQLNGDAAVDAGDAGASDRDSALAYWIGADITDQETAPADVRAKLLALMKEHGFNAVRLRTFVDPRAADGYDRQNGYDDVDHTVEFGAQIKAAGMRLLVDFHYSDNWADPGKQCVPIAWQGLSSIEQLARAVHDYTHDAVTKLVAGGARPDMVQIGNETTPGMLLHRCDADGHPTGANPVNGSTASWPNLGRLLQAGSSAVREVDPEILISFHIDRGGDKRDDTKGAALQASKAWLHHALEYVTPDAFGESCYQKYQGDPSSADATATTWRDTLGGLSAEFPAIRIFAAEYGPLQRAINDVVFALPNQQGLGTFNWEPTTQGDWNTGHDLLRRSGESYTAQPDLALYDQMKLDYADRL